jgi:signal transduction histidine kinase
MTVKYKVLSVFVFSFFFHSLKASGLEGILKNAVKSTDSTVFYFGEAKKNVHTFRDKALYYFYQTKHQIDIGNPDFALFYGKKALESYKALKDTAKLLKSYNNIAKAYQQKGMFKEAISTLLSGLAAAEKSNNLLWQGYYYVNIGLNYHDFEDYKHGVEYGKKAYDVLIKTEKASAWDKVLAINAIAINFDDWSKPDSALFYHFKIIHLEPEIDSISISFTYNNIGNTLLKQKKYGLSEKWIRRALKITDLNKKNMTPVDFAYEKATNLMNIANLQLLQHKTTDAGNTLESAIKYVTQSNSFEKKRDLYRLQYQYNSAKLNYKNAFHFQEKYIALRDSIFEVTRSKNIAEIETRYQTEKKNKEIAQNKFTIIHAEKQNEQKKFWIVILTLSTFFVSVLSLLFLIQQRMIVKQHRKEMLLKEEIYRIETQNQLKEQKIQVSRELHDNIGSQLTFIISAVRNVIFKTNIKNEAIIQQLKHIELFAVETISELRDTIWATKSSDIYVSDLKIRLLQFVEKNKIVNPDLNFSFEIEQSLLEEKLNSFAALNIYRIIQESVNNALKYSFASKISISIFLDEEWVNIGISDNGKGFDINAQFSGNGLENLKKRCSEINAIIDIKSSSTTGTSITLKCPINLLSS